MGHRSTVWGTGARCGTQEHGVGCGSLMELQALDRGGSGPSVLLVRLWAAPIPLAHPLFPHSCSQEKP